MELLCLGNLLLIVERHAQKAERPGVARMSRHLDSKRLLGPLKVAPSDRLRRFAHERVLIVASRRADSEQTSREKNGGTVNRAPHGAVNRHSILTLANGRANAAGTLCAAVPAAFR
jgi:hypothetical protein